MKKTIAVLVSMLMILSLMACGNSADRTEQSPAEENLAEESTGDDTASAEENADHDVNLAEGSADNDAEPADISETQQAESASSEGQDNKILVAYFSATHTTEGVAEHIANGLHADIYEIVPEEPYTDADLNYNDNNSRTTIEMNDPDARPAIFGSVEDMEQYDIVFLGYAGGIIGLNQEKPINQGFALI